MDCETKRTVSQACMERLRVRVREDTRTLLAGYLPATVEPMNNAKPMLKDDALLLRLYADGTKGADMSPGDPIALAAYNRIVYLEALINTPHTNDFLEAVRLEAAHQREHWGSSQDEGKTDADWFWLLGHLAGKAVHLPEKQLHHIITSAAVLLNWHMQRTVGSSMRPGIAPPK